MQGLLFVLGVSLVLVLFAAISLSRLALRASGSSESSSSSTTTTSFFPAVESAEGGTGLGVTAAAASFLAELTRLDLLFRFRFLGVGLGIEG